MKSQAQTRSAAAEYTVPSGGAGDTASVQPRYVSQVRSRNLTGTDELFLAGAPRSAIEDASSWKQGRSGGWIRALNLGVASAAALFFTPVFVLIAIAIKLDSRGPVLYRQVRVGYDRRAPGAAGVGRRREDRGEASSASAGEDRRTQRSLHGRRAEDLGGSPFVIYKFRTMTVDAEDHTGPVWASTKDHRVTRVGHWLRRYRIDEAPQFINVLTGKMSVVGPRPERPTFVKKLRRELAAYALRQHVRPGITGLAQVNRGPDQTVDDVREKLDYDLEYISRRSPWLDLGIMLKTIPVMLKRY